MRASFTARGGFPPRPRESEGAPTIDDLSAHRRALSVLAALGREEPINMARFTRASLLVPERAKALREALEGLGLLDVQVARTQGTAEILEIRLTPLGRQVAQRAVEMDDVLRAAKPKRK
ncbi:MAG TPA: hypothetical protein VHH36_02595 [Candidatus Thermoplasmatota archaeon]|nr:hypothetical protein [Candidatus Thermoplasmatota archaeon]